jgi:hypothetical protein
MLFEAVHYNILYICTLYVCYHVGSLVFCLDQFNGESA